ncbi:MAG: hypothetical protein P8X89_09265 [Reinekea sp.]
MSSATHSAAASSNLRGPDKVRASGGEAQEINHGVGAKHHDDTASRDQIAQ